MAGRVVGMHPPKRPPTEPPAAPVGLSEPERTIFERLVAAVDRGHFTASDLPLLVSYVQAVAQHDRAVQALRAEGDVVNGKLSPWIVVQEKAIRAMTALSMRLRLSPQARRPRAQLPKPADWWEQRQDRQPKPWED
jgi:phage terminase small subunit